MRTLTLATALLFCSWSNLRAADAQLCPDEAQDGFKLLFDGRSLDGWTGSVQGYTVEDGLMVCLKKGGGILKTEREFANFVFRFEFKLEPGANNGVGIRMAPSGDPAYTAMEIQILDDSAPVYATLKPYQYHGSIYGVVPAERGHQKPVGEWNTEEIRADGSLIKIILNGTVIVDADLSKIDKTIDGHEHPGLHREQGPIGFLGHGARIEFRNIRVKELGSGK